MLAILLGLGVWQIQRLTWKLGILGSIAAAEARPAVPLGAGAPGQFAKVTAAGTWRPDLAATYGLELRDTPSGNAIGAQLIEPLLREGQPPLLVDRGWVPLEPGKPLALPPAAASAAAGSVTGFARPAERPGWFAARDDLGGRHFYTLDPAVIGAALGLPDVAPFTLVALGQPPPEGVPVPAAHLPQPPNNHLSYAITWFGLAATLLVVFALYARKTLRPKVLAA